LAKQDVYVKEKVSDRRSKLTKFMLLGKNFWPKVPTNYRHFLKVSEGETRSFEPRV
jgi:hypothetical protein